MTYENRDKTLSLSALNAERDLPVLAWTVRGIIEYVETKHSKGEAKVTLDFAMQMKHRKAQRSFIIYRREIYRLLNAPKGVFEQLILELPCLMGFRSTEVGTWRIENIDFQNGETLVLDAKKHRLLPLPLNTHVAKLVMQLVADRVEGYVLKNRSKAWKGRNKPITAKQVWRIWKQQAYGLELFPDPNDYSPIVGRRFFAAEWYHKKKLPLVSLSRIMRHSNPWQTLDYVNKLIFAEDVKRDYDAFQQDVLSKDLKVKT